MPVRQRHLLLFLTAAALVCGRAAAQDAGDAAPPSPQQLTWQDLAGRFTDLQRLAELPPEGEVAGQASSYNRRSAYDADQEQYVAWNANNDGGGFIRQEGDSFVMAEVEGSGCVWRLWSAEPRQGHMKIYVDGELVVDRPFADYFTAEHAPFDFASLAYETPITPGEAAANRDLGGGRNLYFPIPFQKSLKVVADPDWGRFFILGYTRFAPGTQVPSFDGTLPDDARAALQELDDKLSGDLADAMPTPDGAETLGQTVTLPAGETVEVARLTGARAITSFRVRVPDVSRSEEMDMVRQLAVRMTWDGQGEPAVWSPIGDFFGSAPGVNPYEMLASGMDDEGGMYSNWFMPFENEALIEISNDGEVDRELEVELIHAPLENGFDGLGHFHAKWHRDVFPVSEDRFPDWTVLETTGRGRFVGMMLHVWNPIYGRAPLDVAAPGHYWWGEGDEKFFVDGETFPSIYGTGTEDYFGYAWCDPAPFVRPYHAQTMTQGNAGHQSLVRHQIADDVPFQTAFDAYVEKYFPNDYPTRFAAVAYWYLSPDGTDPHGEFPVDERLGYYAPPRFTAGGFELEAGYDGVAETQPMGNFNGATWSDNNQLWWTPLVDGDEITLLVPVEQAGEYRLNAAFTRAADYAIVDVLLNGEVVKEDLDLFAEEVTRTDDLDLGTHSLDAGTQRLTIRVVGHNPDAIPTRMVGVDEVRFEPASSK